MNKKILIIEDDTIIRENTAEILELGNYDVVKAENGKEGVAKAKEFLPDLIICDIMMPELDGYGVLYILSQNPETASIPFIFLTAKTEKNDLRKGMELGADDYLTKPFDEMDLFKAIEGRFKRNRVLQKDVSPEPKEEAEDETSSANGLEELHKLSQKNEVQNLKKRDIIYNEGDHPKVLYFLKKGRVKLSKMHDDGKEYITSLVKEGDFFGYMSIMENHAYEESAVAIEKSEVHKIAKDDFLSLIDSNREVASKFIKMIANNLHEKEALLLSLAYDRVRKRVANALITLQNCYHENDDKEFSIDISRSDLANMIGTASESVTRTLADFKEEGLIKVDGKQIILTDKMGLEKIW